MLQWYDLPGRRTEDPLRIVLAPEKTTAVECPLSDVAGAMLCDSRASVCVGALGLYAEPQSTLQPYPGGCQLMF